jgi:hypothetical protein
MSGCICPQSNGGIALDRIGYAHEGDVPESEGLPEVRLPGSGRRGKIVVYTSAPYPVTNTAVIEGPDPDTWELVARESRGRDREAFRELLLDPGVTLGQAVIWLKEHGYRISRSAVGNYRKHLQREPDTAMRKMVRGATAAELRTQLCQKIEGMNRSELVALAAFAGFWAKLRGRK